MHFQESGDLVKKLVLVPDRHHGWPGLHLRPAVRRLRDGRRKAQEDPRVRRDCQSSLKFFPQLKYFDSERQCLHFCIKEEERRGDGTARGSIRAS